jgi:biotin-dependent carboxylase-like uncharacterized protein
MLSLETVQIDSPGFGASIQDRGRSGWRRFGVPPSGWMDEHAAQWANRLLDNPVGAAVLELQYQGACLTFLEEAWIAITGADQNSNFPLWRPVHVDEGDVVKFPRNLSGLWAYVAIEGGFEAPLLLGSRSVYPRGHIGRALASGDLLARNLQHSFELPAGVAGRTIPWSEHRNYAKPPPLPVWPGPQWETFAPTERARFFAAEWTVSSQSDRVGYRLGGPALQAAENRIISEPVRVGSIQIPENGQPIVTMRDGPTVGGYAKLGLVDSMTFSWLAQCRPGQKVQFQLAK